MNKNKIREIFESCGKNDIERAHVFNKRINDAFEAKKLELNDFHSIRDLFEAVQSDAFPIITGNLLSKHMIKSYTELPTIGDQLVENVPSSLATDKMPGASSSGAVKEVGEGEPYPHHKGIDEKYVQVEHQKYGAILDITDEMIRFDQTGLVLREAAKIGREAAEFKEKLILNHVQDITDYYSWHPSNTRTAIYSTSTTAPHRTSNQITNALSSWDDIDAANILLGKMTKENGDPILITPKIMLVPIALQTTARRLIANTVMPGAANAEFNPWFNAVKPLSSPYLDAQSTIIWYWGDFQSMFIWKEVIPLEVLTRKDKLNDSAWERDIKASYKVRFDGKCASTDYAYVIKSTGAA